MIGDSSQIVPGLSDGAFSHIIHDPPTLSLAGSLYAGEFYRQLFRVLAGGGRLFHYTGDPNSALGRRVTRGAIRRLRDAGFARVQAFPQAFGLVAQRL
jgi:predicted methyltransferase